MKSVGKQLQEARLARNWTPELAARETKIKVDRLRDLEADDYSHFSSPTYARGFVRTYARSLGLDEYKILRQLDNKLPDDDSANIVTDTGGVAYLPETALPPRAAHQDYTGLYIVTGLAAVVVLAIVFVLVEAYRVGELSSWFGSGQESVASETPGTSTNAASSQTNATTETPARALPVNGSPPPPVVEPATNTAAESAPADTNAPPAAPRALPVDAAATGETNAAPPIAENTVPPPRALPVNDSAAPPPAPAAVPVAPVANPADSGPPPPRALPVNPHDPSSASAYPPVAPPATNVVTNVLPPTAPATPDATSPPTVTPSASSKPTNAIHPIATTPPIAPTATPNANPTGDSSSGKPLVLTASQDSFVRVTLLDSSDTDKPIYASVLHSGQSIAFSGHKFTINVGVPSAVDIKLDGVNYGPHSDGTTPETFTVQSHLQ